MYNLGEQFLIDYKKAVSSPKATIKGTNYRFTILTPRVIRLEYNTSGLFVDAPSDLILYRNLAAPNFQTRDDANYLEISTDYFKLTYTKEKPFLGTKINPSSNLKVELLGTDKVWYYGHPEVRNFNVPAVLLSDGIDTKTKGLYSAEGMASIDDSNHKLFKQNGEVEDRPSKGIDIYLFMYNKDFLLALKDYYELTGYPALVPRYALGNWWSRNDDYNDETLKDVVDTFSKHQIPISTVLLDKDWHIRKYDGKRHLKSGFTFNKDYFKNPLVMVKYLHSKYIKLGLSIDPTEGIYDTETYYSEAIKYLPADKSGKISFNVLDPKFIDVYLKFFIHPLDNMGIDFYWLDTPVENTESNALLKHYQYYDMYRNYKRRAMVMGPNYGLAAHRYPVAYSGKSLVSFSTLRKIPFYNNNAFNIGVGFIAHDIGGYFKGIEDSELYTRFIQLGTFSPILKFGVEKGKYYKREPWRWDIKTYTIAKDFLRLRHRLIPYIYSEAYKYHKDGTPLITPVYYTNPKFYDDVLYRNEYYFGSLFLVCPILEKNDPVMNRALHNFYIPEGIWYDFVTGKKFPGNKNYISFFKDEEYPVFVKQGSIIPMGLNENVNNTTPPVDMEIHIFPGKSNTYTLFEDDGESDLYRKGFYILSEIEYNYMPSNYSVIIRAKEGKSGIIPDNRNYKIVFRNTKRTENVSVYVNRDKVSFKTYVDGADFIVEVKNVSTTAQLTINCKGKDIEIDAVHLITQDIESIINDLQITTEMKDKIDAILFSDLSIAKKRIEIRKLKRKGLDSKFVKMFIKLLEYINEI